MSCYDAYMAIDYDVMEYIVMMSINVLKSFKTVWIVNFNIFVKSFEKLFI